MDGSLAIQWKTSLRVRLSLGVTLTLGILLVAFVMIYFAQHRARMLGEVETRLSDSSRVIKGSLEHAMLTQDRAAIQQILNDVGAQTDIRSVLLLRPDGEIRMAPGGGGVGTRLDTAAPGCQVCHAAGEPPRGGSAIIMTQQGEPALRYCNPIENQPACYACHDARNRLNGVLITDLSLAPTQAHLDAELRETLLGSLLLVLAAVVAVNLFLDRLVLRRLDRMMLGINRFGSGDRSQRLAGDGTDEISRLEAAFNRMADGLQAKELESARLLQQIIHVQEEERKRIARELHDDFAQTLTALTIGLETTLQALPAGLASLRDPLLRVQDLTVTTLGQTHWWIQDLRPTILDDLGLVSAIRWYAETRLEATGIEVKLEGGSIKGHLPPELEITLFRVVQEAINNIAKHAHARHTWIRLTCSDGQIVAQVEDDGAGFDPQEFSTAGDGMCGIGLLGMRERLALLGGVLTLDSAPGRGTRIRIEAPWTA